MRQCRCNARRTIEIVLVDVSGRDDDYELTQYVAWTEPEHDFLMQLVQSGKVPVRCRCILAPKIR